MKEIMENESLYGDSLWSDSLQRDSLNIESLSRDTLYSVSSKESVGRRYIERESLYREFL